MSSTRRRPVRLTITFAGATCRYWLLAFPLARREIVHWRRRAAAIPDARLRRVALCTLHREHGNLEGAAAFALLAPLRQRAAVVRAAVAFQTAYDYADSLAEQAEADGTRALHEALRAALPSCQAEGEQQREITRPDDGGYLQALIATCRSTVATLPSLPTVEPRLLDAIDRTIDYQTLIHRHDSPEAWLAAWAAQRAVPGAELAWWETVAACASSLAIFAQLAAAAHPHLSRDDAAAIDRAYFPWIGALHVLLDSLLDLPDDARTGHHSLVAHYQSTAETAQRLDAISATAFAAAANLPRGELHALLAAAMAAFYLVDTTTQLPHAALARRRVLDASGVVARPLLAVHRLRRHGR